MIDAFVKAISLAEENLGSAVEGFNVESLDFDSLDLVQLAQFQADIKELHEKLDSHKSAVGKVYDYVRTHAVPMKMDEEGVESITVQGVGRVSLTSDIYLKINNKEASFEWLAENGHEDLISETVNASSLKALIRRMLRDGIEIPEDVYQVTPFSRATITKR
jgi:hypothetical protein